jgi:hypothetical protein
LAFGTTKKPITKANNDIIKAPIKYGLKNLLKEMPELKIATISVLLANFDVNQMVAKNRNIGNKKLAKYTIKFK